MNTKNLEKFEIWLKSVCFQQPTPEAHDLAKSAWKEALKQREQMAEVLRVAAYPRRGTDEEEMTVFEIIEMIQANFKLEDLEI